MIFEIGFDEASELITNYYKEMYSDFKIQFTCNAENDTYIDEYGFKDNCVVLRGVLSISKEKEIFGKVRCLSEEKSIYESELLKILKPIINAQTEEESLSVQDFTITKNSIKVYLNRLQKKRKKVKVL